MPTSEAKQRWKEEHRDKLLECYKEYNQKRTFSMRCPKCGKHIHNIRVEYAKSRYHVRCKHCTSKVRIKKVLSVSGKRPKGVKLEVVEDLLETVFSFIKEHPKTYFSEICKLTQISAQKVRSRLKLLIESGLIQVVKDKQIKRFELTQKGQWWKGPVVI